MSETWPWTEVVKPMSPELQQFRVSYAQRALPFFRGEIKAEDFKHEEPGDRLVDEALDYLAWCGRCCDATSSDGISLFTLGDKVLCNRCADKMVGQEAYDIEGCVLTLKEEYQPQVCSTCGHTTPGKHKGW